MTLKKSMEDSMLGMDVQLKASFIQHTFWAALLFIFITSLLGTVLLLKSLLNSQHVLLTEQVIQFTIGLITWSLCIHMATYTAIVYEQIDVWSERIRNLLNDIFTIIDEAFDGKSIR